MGLQMFLKPYRSNQSQILADGLMLMLLLFLLLGTLLPCGFQLLYHLIGHRRCSLRWCTSGVNSQLKGGSDLDGASISVLATLGVLLLVFIYMTISELLSFVVSQAEHDRQENKRREVAFLAVVEEDKVRTGFVFAACVHPVWVASDTHTMRGGGVQVHGGRPAFAQLPRVRSGTVAHESMADDSGSGTDAHSAVQAFDPIVDIATTADAAAAAAGDGVDADGAEAGAATGGDRYGPNDSMHSRHTTREAAPTHFTGPASAYPMLDDNEPPVVNLEDFDDDDDNDNDGSNNPGGLTHYPTLG